LARKTFNVKIMPNTDLAFQSPANAPNKRVVALAYDGLCLFEFGICCELFGLKRPEMGEDWYSFEVASLDPGQPLRASNGVRVEVDGGLDLLCLSADRRTVRHERTDISAPV
jgi:AraC family transcriptional activator FtrA